ncbi:hypothetical protein D3876_08440 [Sphingomonas cavernae]|uniref:Uncharacterized protein n=1 Tax=Sphingomonas cavernae TaxID=2320861 RepID=A0A418WKD7_9SPHN|nr:hypothetical protein D3876_08440 [Sphingomonas cavernae]
MTLNIAIGNVVSHAKDFSALLEPTGARFAPLCDLMSGFAWGEIARVHAQSCRWTEARSAVLCCRSARFGLLGARRKPDRSSDMKARSESAADASSMHGGAVGAFVLMTSPTLVAKCGCRRLTPPRRLSVSASGRAAVVQGSALRDQ